MPSLLSVMSTLSIRQNVLFLILLLSFTSLTSGKQEAFPKVYHNQFAVHIPNASTSLAEQLAQKHGFRSLGQVRQEKVSLYGRAKEGEEEGQAITFIGS